MSSFLSAGWSQFLPGFKQGELTARIFWDSASQLSLGSVLNCNLGIGSSFYILFNCVLMDMSLSTAIDKAGEANITAMTNGSFTTTFAT